MHIENTNVQSKVVWQAENSDLEPIAEPAILIGSYCDIVCVEQNGNVININRNKVNLKALAKIFNQLANDDSCPAGVK